MDWIGPNNDPGLGNLGISVKVKVPSEIKTAAKSFPEFTESITRVSSAADTFGPYYLAGIALLAVGALAVVLTAKHKD